MSDKPDEEGITGIAPTVGSDSAYGEPGPAFMLFDGKLVELRRGQSESPAGNDPTFDRVAIAAAVEKQPEAAAEAIGWAEDRVRCELCGKPMPLGEEMFRYHGHSGPCPDDYNKRRARIVEMEKRRRASPEYREAAAKAQEAARPKLDNIIHGIMSMLEAGRIGYEVDALIHYHVLGMPGGEELSEPSPTPEYTTKLSAASLLLPDDIDWEAIGKATAAFAKTAPNAAVAICLAALQARKAHP